MKKLILLTAGFMALQTSALAHGGCCTLSASYMGIMPQFHKNYVGIRYSARSYTMPAMYMDHGHGLMLHNPESTDRFTSVELWARFYPTRRLQVVATLPYIMNQTTAGLTSANATGMGDAVIMANYALFATPDSALCRVKHRLQAGGGVKLPTGKFKPTEAHTIVLPANFNPGSGTVDYLATAQYTVRLNQIGLTTDFLYKFNNQNNDGYRFGNQATAAGHFFYWLKMKQVSVLPSAGVYLEKSMENKLHGQEVSQTAGTTTFSSAGLDVYYKNLAVGGTWQSPFSRQENGMTKSDRATVHVTVMF